ncbi:DUF618-domain-containing protein [Thozetella sp. PMI_491]|nr:DUF618-domain-containing protein [Thozetella sp. PMI_491]
MSYTDDAVMSRLSALNESHDSIATAAQWIMFHRRYANQTVQLWLAKLKELPSPKRLNMIYLANEVTQQSKARHKDDFLLAFSPIVAEACAVAYKGATADVQGKLRRVIDVWRERNVFEPAIQQAVENRLEDLDKSRAATKPAGFGGSLFGNSSPASVPSELNPLVVPQQNLSKKLFPAKSALSSANSEFEKLTNPSNAPPAPPVYAARLNGLLKTLATAEGAVAECVKARKELIGALEDILSTNRNALEKDERSLAELSSRKTTTETKKQEVELSIMRELASSNNEAPGDAPAGSPPPEPERPEMEALTPPQMEALTPPQMQDDNDFYANSPPANGDPQSPPLVYQSPTTAQQATFPSAPGIEMLSHLASQYQSVPVNGSNKKRKIEASDDFPDLGNDDGIDADVKEILRRDSAGV